MKFLLAFVIFIVVGWSAGWFALSAYLGGVADDAISRLRAAGTDVTCGDRNTSGFPFSMQISCDDISVASPDLIAPVTTGPLAAGVGLTAPQRLRLDLTSPLTFAGGEMQFEDAKAQIDLRTDGGFDGANFVIPTPRLTVGALTAKAEQISGEAQGGEPDLTVSINARDLQTDLPQIGTVPSASVSLFATLAEGYRDLVQRGLSWQQVLSDGAQLNLRSLELVTEGQGRLTVGGNIELRPDGLLNGPLRIAVSNPDALREWVRPLGPQAEQVVATLTQAMNGMGVMRDINGRQMQALDVMIDNGSLRLGFIKIGDIPPLRLN
ncbi:MAG: DUF2125 domain-containing protein [Pseudomonadota bacterium]